MKKLLGIAAAIGAALFLVWIGWAFLKPILANVFGIQRGIDKLGQWGDTFGALNALFGAFGFSVVAATLYLQQKQNENNEKDQHLQRFDENFFRILALLRETRGDVEFRYSLEYTKANPESSRDRVTGTRAFRAAWREYIYWHEIKGTTVPAASAGRLYYNRIHKRYESNFGPYYRLLYNTMRRIKDDPVISERDKVTYARLLRGQLNSHETALAGLNGLTKVSKDFSKLIIEFRLLKYLPQGSRRRSVLRKYYPRKCFAARPTKKSSYYLYGPSADVQSLINQ